MVYQSQTMSEQEMEERLASLLERAKSLNATVSDAGMKITNIINQTEAEIDQSIAVVDNELDELLKVEKEVEVELDTIILTQAKDLADDN